MTRFELENWCERFLKDIFENSNMVNLTKKAAQENWDGERFQSETIALLNGYDFKTYEHFIAKSLADFIEQFSKEVGPSEAKK